MDPVSRDMSTQDYESALLATGALLTILPTIAGLEAEPVDLEGEASNMIDIKIFFLKPTYRITVERLADGT